LGGELFFSLGLCLWEMICGIKIYDRKRKKRLKLGGFAKLKDRFKDIYQDLFNEAYLHSELEDLDLEADDSLH
jgi:hypothetical protein